jgi:two-component system copper resistance phosphate regulon response regulator CusR
MRILLIEDEPDIADVIKMGLEQAHYRVEVESDGRAGLATAEQHLFGLILLDVMLPGLDGFQICERLREQGIATPILMLTARDAVPDRVRGLGVGADDYLPKPFDFSELLARIEALLRRDRLYKSRTIRIDDLEIETGMRRVTRAGQEVTLTPREYTLLEALAARAGQVLTRETIQERVWLDEDSSSNTVDVYIGILRKKIDSAHDHKLIQTVHGVGYTIKPPQETANV